MHPLLYIDNILQNLRREGDCLTPSGQCTVNTTVGSKLIHSVRPVLQNVMEVSRQHLDKTHTMLT